MTKLHTRLPVRVALLALVATLPLILALFYLQADERAEELARTVPEHRRIARLATFKASEIVGDAERLVTTVADAREFDSGNRADCAPFLHAVLQDRPGLINIAVIDRRGELVCSGVPVKPEAFRRSTARPWFAQSLRAERVISDPFLTATTGAPAIVVTAKIPAS